MLIAGIELVPIKKDVNWKTKDFGTFLGKTPKREVVVKKGDISLAYEAMLLRRLDSHYFPKVLHFFKEKSAYYLVLEKKEGQTLKSMIHLDKNWKSTPIEYRKAIEITKELAHAFGVLHSNNILYRDLNLGHIITNQKTLSLVDLESCITQHPDGKYYNFEARGTWENMAPEEFEEEFGSELTAATNIYSIGITFAQLVLGYSPMKIQQFEKDSRKYTKSEQYKIHKQKMPEIRTGKKEIERIIKKCISKEPKNRYQSTAELLKDLKRV